MSVLFCAIGIEMVGNAHPAARSRNALAINYFNRKPLYIRLKRDSSFRSATFRMTFSACHSEEGTTEESQRFRL